MKSDKRTKTTFYHFFCIDGTHTRITIPSTSLMAAFSSLLNSRIKTIAHYYKSAKLMDYTHTSKYDTTCHIEGYRGPSSKVIAHEILCILDYTNNPSHCKTVMYNLREEIYSPMEIHVTYWAKT
jgi:hypothetical protein